MTNIILLILLAIFLIILVPIAFLWALNTLGFAVAYTPWTWAAAFVILVLLNGGSSKK